MEKQRAIFAAGCFWGVEAKFSKAAGVLQTRVGYTGGQTPRPTYEQVCAGGSGHAEAVEVWFDSAQTSFAQLLNLFWQMHDPTQVNRQGPDVGEQYRSAVFCIDEEQEQTATASKAEQERQRGAPLATQIARAGEFWLAEEYHQQYVAKRSRR